MNLTDDEIKLAYEERLEDDRLNRADMRRRTRIQTIDHELCWAGPDCPHCHPTDSRPF
jgi:hypothetical protein